MMWRGRDTCAMVHVWRSADNVMTLVHPFLPFLGSKTFLPFLGSKEQTRVSNLAWWVPLLTEPFCCASIFAAFGESNSEIGYIPQDRGHRYNKQKDFFLEFCNVL